MTPMALEGIRVIDQTQIMAGPSCTMLLADMGADVIKVEPPEGETTREMDPKLANGISAAFLAVNRNKRSVGIDLKKPRGVDVFKKLVATADVLVENYRPDVAKRLGVDYETLAAINPRLIYCETTREMDPKLANGISAAFLAVNRNKRSVGIDLKKPRGVDVFKKLVATADVLVENYRPDVAKRLGVDYETLAAINPRLIYC